MLSALGNYIVATSSDDRGDYIKKALQHIPNPSSDCVVREVAVKVSTALLESGTKPALLLAGIPDKNTLTAVMLIAWACATGKEEALHAPIETIQTMIANEFNGVPEIYATCREALEIMSVMYMLNPQVLEVMVEESHFKKFVVDLVLISPER